MEAKRVVDLLEAEALRHRAMAMVSGPETLEMHREVADALEFAALLACRDSEAARRLCDGRP